jgi:hypothetical protein
MSKETIFDSGKIENPEDIFAGNVKVQKFDDGSYCIMCIQLDPDDKEFGFMTTIVNMKKDVMLAMADAIAKSQ